MTKFLHIVEQNLPDSDYQDQFNLLMKFKEDTLALYKSGKLDFFIAPIHNTGSVELISRDGKKCILNLRANEEAEDPVMKKPNPLNDMLNKADPRLLDKAKRAALAVGSELERIAANRPK
jgi:hypothetical protein